MYTVSCMVTSVYAHQPEVKAGCKHNDQPHLQHSDQSHFTSSKDIHQQRHHEWNQVRAKEQVSFLQNCEYHPGSKLGDKQHWVEERTVQPRTVSLHQVLSIRRGPTQERLEQCNFEVKKRVRKEVMGKSMLYSPLPVAKQHYVEVVHAEVITTMKVIVCRNDGPRGK